MPSYGVSKRIGERKGVKHELARNVNFAAHRDYAIVKDQVSKCIGRGPGALQRGPGQGVGWQLKGDMAVIPRVGKANIIQRIRREYVGFSQTQVGKEP